MPHPAGPRVPSGPAAAPAPRFAGLSQEEAAARAARGQANTAEPGGSRSLGDILRANLLTRFNALLGSLLVVILVVGPPQDAVFGLLLVLNAVIGIAQELRAKLTLERLALLAAPEATVVRDGSARRVPVAEVVLGDLVRAGRGDEVVVDGVLEPGPPVELDEALLTGESVPVTRQAGEEVLAGSFVSAGEAAYVATRVGEASYARRLTVEARRFQLVRSELMAGINRILRVVTWVIAPTAALLVVSQLFANPSLPDALRGAVAGVVTLVPEGLVLLTSASLALAVIRLGRRRVLVQQLPAVEMLARTDVVCMDKTGTITEPVHTLTSVEELPGAAPGWAEALGAIARVERDPGPSLAAVAASRPAPAGWTVEASVPFSSARKWSAARFAGRGWWVVGAPDRLLGAGQEAVARRVRELVAAGGRVLLLGTASGASPEAGVEGLRPAALLCVGETVKPDAAATVARLQGQRVAVILLSGDDPATVTAIASAVGVPPEDCFGRLTPEQKRDRVAALRSAGHTVAMVGDGVNDVLALKEADLGIAMGAGSAAARAIGAVVLLDGAFAGIPAVLAEGRRVIGNVERLASLYFTKTVYAFLLALAVSFAVLPFPFLPRQLTLISAFTIGIPSVLLALAPSFEPSGRGFMARVLQFAVPAGAVAAAATFGAYALAVGQPDLSIREERTVATFVMGAIGLWILARLARPLTPWRRAWLAVMGAGLVASFLLPPLAALFDLVVPGPAVALAAVGMVSLALLGLEGGDRLASLSGAWLTRIRLRWRPPAGRT